MATSWQAVQVADAEADRDSCERWFALQTRARHEKIVKERLEIRGVQTFLPTVTEIHKWSDRKKKVEVPVFSCYLFARLTPTRMDRLRVLSVDGIFSFVGNRGEGLPIPDEQIEAVRTLVDSKIPCLAHPFLKIGQRVRIRSGSLNGIEGILVSRSGEDTLVLCVDAIERSLSVRLDGYQVETA